MQLLGSAKSITDFTVPVGARTFHVSDTSGLGVGDSILITRPSTAEWIHDIGMDQLDEPWQPGSKNLKYERVITRIEGKDVYLELPPQDVLDSLLATEIGCSLATSCDTNPDLVAAQ